MLDGDHFVVNGQKVWTSGAHHADWCLCFVRTDPDAAEAQGDQRARSSTCRRPGVEARPFAELSEPDFFDFNEVFFTDAVGAAREPARRAQRGLADHAGLARARTGDAVDHLRVRRRSARSPRSRRSATGPRPDGALLRDDARYRDEVAGFAIDAQALMLHGVPRLLEVHEGSVVVGALAAEAVRERVGAAVPARGHRGARRRRGRPRHLGPPMWREGSWAIQYLRSFGGTIPGGTSEIQRNIIAERVLGLPRR